MKRMRLSEAMRAGMKMTPRQLDGQLGGWGDLVGGGIGFGTCALGAAYLGAGINSISGEGEEKRYQENKVEEGWISKPLNGKLHEVYERKMEVWSVAWERAQNANRKFTKPEPTVVKCPVRGCSDPDETDIEEAIVHLNDHHGKSRAYIANWIERLEIKFGLAPRKKAKKVKKEKIVDAKYDHDLAKEIKEASRQKELTLA